MKTFKSIVIVSIMLLSCSVVNPVSSNTIETTSTGTTFYVDDDYNSSTPGWGIDHFNLIQDAINASSNNDTVFVYNGEYNESVVINKSIVLKGEDNQNTILYYYSYDYGNYPLIIIADNVTVENFKIMTISKYPYDGFYNIQIRDSNYSKIKNNVIEGAEIGVSLNNCYFNEITGNHLINNSISIRKSDSNLISRNYLKKDGISIVESNNNEISYNKIIYEPSEYDEVLRYQAMYITDGSSDNLITYNHIEWADVGIYLGTNFENTFSYNDFISIKYLCVIDWGSNSKWYHNYWERSRVLPKPVNIFYNSFVIWCRIVSKGEPNIIFGNTQPRIILKFDMRPALKPNCDFGGDD